MSFKKVFSSWEHEMREIPRVRRTEHATAALKVERATRQGSLVPGSGEHWPTCPPSSSQQGNGLHTAITRNGTRQVTGRSWKVVKPLL